VGATRIRPGPYRGANAPTSTWFTPTGWRPSGEKRSNSWRGARFEEVGWVWVGLDRYLVVTDANERHVVVCNGFTNLGELRQAICQRVNDVMLPKTLGKLAEGKPVRFGPFTLRRSGLTYKDRKANWRDVTSMKIVNHRGDIRLTIYTTGRLLAWCWCDIHRIPNWDTFYDAVCRTAPEHLLTTSTRPRW
jgi:hypothetical protein